MDLLNAGPTASDINTATVSEQINEAGGRSSSAIGAFNIDFQAVNDDSIIRDTCPQKDFVVRPNSWGYPNNYGKIVNKAQICAEQEEDDELHLGSFAPIYGRTWRYYHVNNRYPINRCCPLSSNTSDCSTHYRLNIDTPEVTPSGHPWPDCSYLGPLRRCGPPASGLLTGTYVDPPSGPATTQFCHANNIYHSDLSWLGDKFIGGLPSLSGDADSRWTQTDCRQSWQPER